MASLLAVIIPTAVYASIVWWFDRYEKGPFSLLAVAFLWGAVPAAIFSVIGEPIFNPPFSLLGSAGDPPGKIVVAPVVEELIKATTLIALILSLHIEFDSAQKP